MNDFIDQTFSELDAYYPGSKRKRREPAAPKEKPFSDWEDEFFEKTLPNGEKVNMYTLGSLAKALNRSTKTLRLWMDEGKLPTSPYRLPSTTGKNGKEYAGRRLYSKRMVEATVEIFASSGLLDTDRVDWSLHRNLGDKIAEAWDKIRADEMKTQ
jgi:hypothetical protein